MKKIIAQVAKHIENGGVVSLPTETVYSLSANAYDDNAVDRIYKLKGRKKDNPLALLVGSIEKAKEIVEFNKNAEILAERFFPGPITLILQKKHNAKISPLVNEGLQSLGVRMPRHEMTLEILNSTNVPIIGTSANPSGMPAATNPDMVYKYFSDSVDMILDGGMSDIGIASTIVKLTTSMPIILRQGAITIEQIEDALNINIIKN